MRIPAWCGLAGADGGHVLGLADDLDQLHAVARLEQRLVVGRQAQEQQANVVVQAAATARARGVVQAEGPHAAPAEVVQQVLAHVDVREARPAQHAVLEPGVAADLLGAGPLIRAEGDRLRLCASDCVHRQHDARNPGAQLCVELGPGVLLALLDLGADGRVGAEHVEAVLVPAEGRGQHDERVGLAAQLPVDAAQGALADVRRVRHGAEQVAVLQLDGAVGLTIAAQLEAGLAAQHQLTGAVLVEALETGLNAPVQGLAGGGERVGDHLEGVDARLARPETPLLILGGHPADVVPHGVLAHGDFGAVPAPPLVVLGRHQAGGHARLRLEVVQVQAGLVDHIPVALLLDPEQGQQIGVLDLHLDHLHGRAVVGADHVEGVDGGALKGAPLDTIHQAAAVEPRELELLVDGGADSGILHIHEVELSAEDGQLLGLLVGPGGLIVQRGEVLRAVDKRRRGQRHKVSGRAEARRGTSRQNTSKNSHKRHEKKRTTELVHVFFLLLDLPCLQGI